MKGNKDSWISISSYMAGIGMILGVATLIIVLSVMQGFANQLTDRILTIQGHINISGWIEDYRNIARSIDHPLVTKITPILEQQLVASHNGQTVGVLVHGKEPTEFRSDLDTGPEAKSASLVTEKTVSISSKAELTADMDKELPTNPIILGKQLAQELGVKAGQEVQLLHMIETPLGPSSSMETFTVSKIVSYGLNQYDRMLCIVKMDDLQTFLDMPDVVSNILVFTKQAMLARQVAQALQKQFYSANIPYHIDTWQENNAGFAQVLSTQRNVMFIVITLMIVIASFNGISSLMALVKEKTKEIAILRTLGASKGQILGVFLVIGSILSSISVGLGVLLGLLISYNIDFLRLLIERLFSTSLFPQEFYNLDALPVHLEFSSVAMIAAWALGLALLAILYPCLQALKVDVNRELRG